MIKKEDFLKRRRGLRKKSFFGKGMWLKKTIFLKEEGVKKKEFLSKRNVIKKRVSESFGTYSTHAQTCDVTRVQSATQWTASEHTLHMPKPVM